MSYLSSAAQYYVTHLQYDEINNTKNELRKRDLLGILQTVGNKKYPIRSDKCDILKFEPPSLEIESAIKSTSSAVYGVSKYGMATYGSGTLYKTILVELNKLKPKQKENNIKDALNA